MHMSPKTGKPLPRRRPRTTTSDTIVARPDARDQFTDERVLLRVDAGFRPQRAESALESSPSASQAARPWTRGQMVAELVQPRAASAETNVSEPQNFQPRKQNIENNEKKETYGSRSPHRK